MTSQKVVVFFLGCDGAELENPPNVVLSEDPQPSSSDKVRKDKVSKVVELV